MTIQAKITHLPLDEIKVPRELRQRTDLTPESVLDLAKSIGQTQWISPLLVDQESLTLVAGERRLTAVKLLRSTADAVARGQSLDEVQKTLASCCTCTQRAWENWSKIPAQLGVRLTPTDLKVYEFIENKERMDLSWQDKAKAVYEIHAECKTSNSKWTAKDTGELLGLSPTSISNYLEVYRASLSGDSNLTTVVTEAPTLKSAVQTIDRIRSRRGENKIGVKLSSAGATAATAPKPEPELEPELDSPSIPLIHQDFHKWAAFYNGPLFNFVHCDFPYGISFNRSGGQNTAVDTKLQGSYDDSEDVYWGLIQTLYEYRQTLLAESCHIMFWLSQNHRRKTEDTFRDLFRAQIQDHLMIWHCSDNSGICPDPNRYGRRTYETAMLITLGDRKITSPKALSCSFPRNEERIHRSQKPLSVLTHFFQMFVDETTVMLDPTCGSGTSVIVARNLGAKSVLGIDNDEQTHLRAVEYYKKESAL